jgi:glucosamine 6-phosphate synthetase-like amidotransferase/phosphosugar isomerase protein
MPRSSDLTEGGPVLLTLAIRARHTPLVATSMCGIAGYSLLPSSRIDRTLAAQVLLAAIAERGADAVGYAFRGPGVPLNLRKQRSGASQLLEHVHVPRGASELVLHVRDYTKGHPRIDANNHPVRHGPVVGVHNGIILNDEEIFAARSFERAQPEMTVDSEAIFALAEAVPGRANVLEELYGSMAAAWLDERAPDVLSLARGVGRPLWLGQGEDGIVFASTRFALEMVEGYLALELDKSEVEEGSLISLSAGRILSSERFSPNRAFEEEPLPAVRAPHERASCLRLIAAIAAT